MPALRPALCNLFRMMVWIGCLVEMFRRQPEVRGLMVLSLFCFALDRLFYLGAIAQPIRWHFRKAVRGQMTKEG